MTFVNPANLVAKLDLPKGATVVDFGCGGGYFCIPAARLIGDEGMVYAVDILPPRLDAVASTARHSGLRNVVTVQADLEKPLAGVPATSCDWVFMANVVHQVGERQALFANAYRVLKTGGHALVMEWRDDAQLFGPPSSQRVPLSELAVLCERLGLRQEKQMEPDTFHYAAVFVK